MLSRVGIILAKKHSKNDENYCDKLVKSRTNNNDVSMHVFTPIIGRKIK